MIETARYGTLPDGRAVALYTLTNGNGLRIRLTNYGAITASVETPDRFGRPADITLGYDTLAGWLENRAYLGATVGRCANRIARGRFTLDGREHQLSQNDGVNHLHGGRRGFDQVPWHAEPLSMANAAGVKFSYLSKDGEEGYPGELRASATYSLNDVNEFKAEFSAVTDQPTIVNLAHHSYWNLSGDAATDILDHELLIPADHITAVDAALIPTGALQPVLGTAFDFNAPKAIRARLADVPGGYDHNFVLRAPGGLHLAAQLHDPKSGRRLELFTDQPGVQFYSGNFLDGTVRGKRGVPYAKHWGLCLETQHFPDSPNHPDFPSIVLRPGETYRHVMIHRFSAG